MRYRTDATSSLTAATGLLMAMAATLGYLEVVLLPPLPVPGMRLGLANIAIVLALVTVGPARALAVSLGRVLLVGLATGALGGPASVLSAVGALAAWGVMSAIASRGDRYSMIGWSLAGSSAHVIAQLCAATVLVSSAAPLLLAPVSLALSLPTGLLIGYSARLLLSRVPLQTVSVASR
ncbi:MAG: Gx transporter family protein [Actinomycetota bacterium]|nr:Gx transporter family protein [Actinomycetota bacterium]